MSDVTRFYPDKDNEGLPCMTPSNKGAFVAYAALATERTQHATLRQEAKRVTDELGARIRELEAEVERLKALVERTPEQVEALEWALNQCILGIPVGTFAEHPTWVQRAQAFRALLPAPGADHAR